MLSVVGDVLLALTLFCCALMATANAALLYQVYGYLNLRSRGLAIERKLLARKLPRDGDLPHVVLQIPVFNEGALVKRSLVNALRLDWPKDRLHIQICDDSTDHTTAIARKAAAEAVAEGFDVAVFHRDVRTNFKAGSLQAAMNQSPHNYFAILDVDFVCPPDFLRRCMAILVRGRRLAFVQARPVFFNADANWLTRGQAMLLDHHYALEQPMRSWSGYTLPFNGTCGVWRRMAIELSGGWRGETLAEDFELTYHARLNGMRGVYITSVTASGELPADLKSWMPQQRRWAKGIGQVAWKMMPRVFSHDSLTTLKERIGAFFPLAMWFVYAVFTATYLLAIPTLLLKPSWALGIVIYAAYAVTMTMLLVLMWFSTQAAGHTRPLGRFLFDFIPVPFLLAYVSWAHFWSAPSIVFGGTGIFTRTPKRGSSAVAP